MRYLYNLLFYCLLPFILLRMLWRSRKAPAYRQRLLERFGLFDSGDDRRPAIWVHAVSVGETLAAAPVIEELLSRYPQYRMVVTTTTPTGSERVRALFGERVFHVYAPWDLPGAVRRFLVRIQPELLLIMETELWPNMLHQSAAVGCPILLANARLSARSARGYGRLGPLTRQMLDNIDIVAAQSLADGDRFLELGLPKAALEVTGSIKFDLDLNADLQQQVDVLRQQFGAGQRPIVVVASTHPGEDEQVLAAFSQLKQLHMDCLLVLVPRHPERFDSVFSLCQDAGWQVRRRSSGVAPEAADDILLGDTMGELLLMLGTARVAVIGGSLIEHGGHNALEASAWGVPVVTGPHMFNFIEISDLLVAAGAMAMLEDPAQLGKCLQDLLADPQRCQQMGAAGLQVVAENRGARGRLLQLADSCLNSKPA
jgi:3-deoxy-D-manno-octulosonic-acid transferase